MLDKDVAFGAGGNNRGSVAKAVIQEAGGFGGEVDVIEEHSTLQFSGVVIEPSDQTLVLPDPAPHNL